MNSTIIIHKISLYVNCPDIVKILFYDEEYRECIKKSDLMYDELYWKYGNGNYWKVTELRSIQSMVRLGISVRSEENDGSIVEYIARKGKIEILEWLSKNTELKFSYAMDEAASKGQLETLKWLYKNRLTLKEYRPCGRYGIEDAVRKNYLRVLKWIHKKTEERANDNIIIIAAYAGHLRILRYLQKHGYNECDNYNLDAIASKCNLEALKWLYRHGYIKNPDKKMIISTAAANGCFLVVKWLYEKRDYKEFYDWSLDYAALGGNIEIVKWLYKNIKQEWIIDKRTIRILSRKKDHLKMIKFLYKLFGKNDEIFSKTVISDSIFEAKIYNNIEIMEYLVHIYEVKKY